MPKKLVDTLVEKLVRRIEQSPDLPSIARLSQQWGVAYNTLSKAVRVLVDKGKLECFPGRGIRVAATKGQAASNPACGAGRNRLYADLRTRILEGTVRHGEVLPKLHHFSLDNRISRHTIVRALRALEYEALIHKKGRQWIVGPLPPAPLPRTAFKNQQVVLIVAPYLGNLRNFYIHDFTARFIIPFNDELSHAGISENFIQMYTGDTRPDVRRKALADAQNLVSRLGSRFSGALIERGPFQFDEHAESMDEWVRCLLAYEKPVMFFDFNGTSEAFSRGRYGNSRRYYRFFLDEMTAVRKAVRFLIDAGHRHMGFCMPSGDASPWIARRAAMAESAARKMTPPADVLSIIQDEPIWQATDKDFDDSMQERIMLQIQKKGQRSPHFTSRQRTLIDNTPSFRKLLESEATAMISPSDEYAFAHYQWLMEAGIKIPEHLSMISFDNSSDLALFPVSTIDFGFSRLGHLAAHVFIDQLPLRLGTSGNVAGECTVIDRGSVDAPRKRPIGDIRKRVS